MQEHLGKASTELQILRKNLKEMLEIPNPIIDIKNVYDKFINKLDKFEERVSELEDRSL